MCGDKIKGIDYILSKFDGEDQFFCNEDCLEEYEAEQEIEFEAEEE